MIFSILTNKLWRCIIIVELIEVVLDSMLTLVSPEKTAEKIKDTNTSRATKNLLIVLFILIYGVALVGMVFSLILVPDVLYKVFAVILIIFLLYCIFIFYNRIFTCK